MDIKTSLKQAAVGTSLIGAAAIAAHFIAPLEGMKLKAYRDAGGVWTICRGHTKNVHDGDVANKQQCEKWYDEDILAAENIYDHNIRTTLPDNTKAAVISFIFNTGEGNLKKSTLMKKLNRNDRIGACNEFPKWRFVGTHDCKADKGLVNGCYGVYDRRIKEQSLCLDNTVYMSYSWDASGAFIGSGK